MNKRIIKNYPSPRLMETIGATNQKPAEAIGELVANSFDARNNDEKLKITIDLRNNQIVVIDNGKGMTFNVLEKAVCIAEDMSKHIKREKGTKGHFGMGFKTSCSTLGYYYEIYTRPKDNELEYHVCFDIKEYSDRPLGTDAWDVEIDEDIPSDLSPLKRMKYGTAFVISSLKIKSLDLNAIVKYLGKAFKRHIKTGDIILVIDQYGNTHEIVPSEYDIIEGTKIDIDIRFKLDQEYSITGWVALDKKVHNDGKYGFNIYRHGQIIESWCKDWIKKHLMTSRIIGEVNMDFLDSTFYKQGAQQSELWNKASVRMSEFLDQGMVKASRDISSNGNINKCTEIIKELKYKYGIESVNSRVENVINIINNGEQQTININKNSKEELVSNDQEKVSVIIKQTRKNENVEVPFYLKYSESFNDNDSELRVIICKNNPFWMKDKDVVIKALDDINEKLKCQVKKRK